MDRRKFIAAAGATVTSISLAGCANPEDGDTAGGVGGTEDTDAIGGDTDTEMGGGDTDTEMDDGEETTTDSDGETTTGDGGGDPSEAEGELDEISQYVEVTSHEAFAEGDAVGVRGTIENTADQALDSVEVEVTLNDGDTLLGEFIDTSDEEIDSLASGETWDFEVTIDDEVMHSETTYTISVDADLAEDANDTGTETST